MAKKQTRRSVSMNRGLYEKLKEYSERTQKSMSSIVEKQIRIFLNLAENELISSIAKSDDTPGDPKATDPER